MSLSPVEEHRKAAESLVVRFCAVVTSDAVYEGRRRDEVTPLIASLVTEAGHILINAVIVPNKHEEIRKAVTMATKECDVVIVTGGTGISRKDLSVDVVKELCVKDLPGFGELFRYLTFTRYGTAAMATRAFACATGSALVFVTPGSKDAVNMALNELILPEVKHLVYEIRKS